jgi:PAS domain S-box-containing protein
MFDESDVKNLIERFYSIDEPTLIRPGVEDQGELLSSLKMQTSFVLPLNNRSKKLGLLVLLDIMDLKGTDQILDALKSIAGLLSLILHNSFLYRNLETLVDQRTKALKESEEKYRLLFDNAGDGILILDMKGKIQAINRKISELLGYTEDELRLMNLADLDTSDEAELSRIRLKILSEKGSISFNTTHLCKGGSSVSVEVNAQRIFWNNQPAIFCICRDITERKRTEQLLQNTQKLESLGILAGGIAHDFNNLLGGIFGYIDLAQADFTGQDPKRFLSKAMDAIERARGLTQQLLTFSKGGMPIQKVSPLFPFVQETAQFALSGSNISLKCTISNDLHNCFFDKNQVGQVIDNIVINAQQAMPLGGVIELRAENIIIEKDPGRALSEGHYVKISVTDQGIGIPESIITKIFDPFFTTKPKGHGLGLATCYSIIRKHGGCIEVQSQQGKGSTFHVYLPAIFSETIIESKKTLSNHSGKGMFLVMDDEPVMRDTIGAMLSSFGYIPVLKENGSDIIDSFESLYKDKYPVSGMIFDLTVPGAMGGKDAVEIIRKTDRKVPVFVMSGYTDDPVMANPAEFGFTASICKPFSKNDFSKLLNDHLFRDP